MWQIVRMHGLNNEAYFTVVLHGMDKDFIRHTEIIKAISNDFWSIGISNVYILIEDGHDLSLHTFYPYDGSNCGTAQPITVNVYREGFFASKLDLFVDKFENMQKCKIAVAVTDNRPVMLVRVNQNGTKFLTGMDGDIMNELASLLNFTVNVVVVPKPKFRHTLSHMVNILIRSSHSSIIKNECQFLFAFVPSSQTALPTSVCTI